MDRPQGPSFDPAILTYYNRRAEETRLDRGVSQLEAARTRELLYHLTTAEDRAAAFADADFAAAVERAVTDGQHRNPNARDGLFTTAYFHRPEELAAELRTGGFEILGLYGIEGPARMLADFEERWADPRRRADMLRLAALVESEPSLLGLSDHLLAVGRKPRPVAAA